MQKKTDELDELKAELAAFGSAPSLLGDAASDVGTGDAWTPGPVIVAAEVSETAMSSGLPGCFESFATSTSARSSTAVDIERAADTTRAKDN